MRLRMKALRSEIKEVIMESGGYPNYSRREYLDAIGHTLLNRLSDKQVEYTRRKNIDLDALIMEITAKLTSDIF